MTESNIDEKILIMGLGNVLLNDEGIGVQVVREMEKMKLPANVDLLDGGTGGFVLLSLFQEYRKLIIIDATLGDDEIGSIKVLKPKFASDFPKSLSTHELGMKDMIESAILLEKVPELFLVAVNINPRQDMDMKVSNKMMKKIPLIIKEVLGILDSIN
jgi:hydrogenase maturation protease